MGTTVHISLLLKAGIILQLRFIFNRVRSFGFAQRNRLYRSLSATADLFATPLKRCVNLIEVGNSRNTLSKHLTRRKDCGNLRVCCANPSAMVHDYSTYFEGSLKPHSNLRLSVARGRFFPVFDGATQFGGHDIEA